MRDPSSNRSALEIEAKFGGGATEYRKIVDWLGNDGGFSNKTSPPVHRFHVYFDFDSVLQQAGCRLRCVIAAGEWCRYDFKVEDQNGRGETVEVSIKKSSPAPLANVIQEMLEHLGDTRSKQRLLQVRDSAHIVLAMTGEHVKTISTRGRLKIEVSWDVVIPVDTGMPLSEIEVELCSGARSAFDRLTAMLQVTFALNRIRLSKIDRALRPDRRSIQRRPHENTGDSSD